MENLVSSKGMKGIHVTKMLIWSVRGTAMVRAEA